MRSWRPLFAALSVLLALAAQASGHPAVSAVAVVKVSSDRRFELLIQHDALAFALNELPTRITDAPMYELLRGPETDMDAALADGRDRMASELRLLADGVPLALEMAESPTLAGIARWKRENPAGLLPIKMEFAFTGLLPEEASRFTIQFPQMLGDVILTIQRPGAEDETLPLRPGEVSPAFDVRVRTGGEDGGASLASESTLGVAWRYVKLGFTHIVPLGMDHVLFVLGLFLLSPRMKPLLWQITAFTIAHSTTLTLASLGLVHLSPSALTGVVEPMIAGSIAFVAVENVFTTKMHAWRPVIAFVFGLVHGLGFASALSEAGVPTGKLVAGLVAFNVGVECGHLTVIAAALLVLGWWRDRPWYRRGIVIPGSLAIAAVAVVWTVLRLV
jgi:hypothetical protein